MEIYIFKYNKIFRDFFKYIIEHNIIILIFNYKLKIRKIDNIFNVII